MEKQLNNNEDFTTYWLFHADQNIVFNWLNEFKPKKEHSALLDDRKELEKKLLERNEPLINLGLALYGINPETGISLFYNTKEKIIKKAVLSGTTVKRFMNNWVTDTGLLKNLVDSFEVDLLWAYLSNEMIDDETLVSLYKKKEPFQYLDNENWYKLLWATAYNNRLSESYDDSWLDGWDDYQYHRVFSEGWRLLEKLPVNDETAILLSQIGLKLVPHTPPDMNLMEVINRWNVKPESESIDRYLDCRYALARNLQFSELKNNSDIALRRSYYRRFYTVNPADIKSFYQKVGEGFLDEAIENENLYRNDKLRELLRECCFDYSSKTNHDLLHVNMMNAREKLFSKHHPEWFKEFDGDLPFDENEKPIRNDIMHEYIKRIDNNLINLSKDLLENKTFAQDKHNDEIKSSSNIFKNPSANINIPNKRYWLWIILGIIIGYFLSNLF